MVKRKKKKLTYAQILRSDRAYGGWYRIAYKLKNGKWKVVRRPTKANIDIVAKILRKKGRKFKIKELKRVKF